VRDLCAEHARHDDVRDEQVDLPVVVARGFEGLGAAGGGDDVVSGAGEDPLGDLAQLVVVLDEEDCLSVGLPAVTGSVIVKVVPFPGCEEIWMPAPAWVSIP
jgi:hypothetical protein